MLSPSTIRRWVFCKSEPVLGNMVLLLGFSASIFGLAFINVYFESGTAGFSFEVTELLYFIMPSALPEFAFTVLSLQIESAPKQIKNKTIIFFIFNSPFAYAFLSTFKLKSVSKPFSLDSLSCGAKALILINTLCVPSDRLSGKTTFVTASPGFINPVFTN